MPLRSSSFVDHLQVCVIALSFNAWYSLDMIATGLERYYRFSRVTDSAHSSPTCAIFTRDPRRSIDYLCAHTYRIHTSGAHQVLGAKGLRRQSRSALGSHDWHRWGILFSVSYDEEFASSYTDGRAMGNGGQ